MNKKQTNSMKTKLEEKEILPKKKKNPKNTESRQPNAK